MKPYEQVGEPEGENGMGLDLHEEIESICGKLGVEHSATRKIEFYPDLVRAEVMKRNESGAFYLTYLADGNAEPAVDVVEAKVARS